ncbi:uncharacterized protein LOC106874960 [Octopus bimaculoides]|uniref:uncharacterized protein LOC106874960 n=1 Tax=Octopus bimaculoides TaxID=37653 RepID=UPI00071CB1B3|nr:uncharacterized protein LOC106874960 [Octopus bimaculoides]|eukprot:XP_014778369.1 PREDICTED: uncharacterized protein LOC106874960 [Octopus bimaculoides]
MSWNIARTKRPYSDEEFVKNIAEVVAVLYPNNIRLQRLIAQTPIPCQPTGKRISQISADVAGKMQNDFKNSLAFGLALDEPTNIQDNPQLAVFIRYVFSDVT